MKGKIDRLYMIFLNVIPKYFRNSVVIPWEPGLIWFFISFKAVLHSGSVMCPSQLFCSFSFNLGNELSKKFMCYSIFNIIVHKTSFASNKIIV